MIKNTNSLTIQSITDLYGRAAEEITKKASNIASSIENQTKQIKEENQEEIINTNTEIAAYINDVDDNVISQMQEKGN